MENYSLDLANDIQPSRGDSLKFGLYFASHQGVGWDCGPIGQKVGETFGAPALLKPGPIPFLGASQHFASGVASP